MGERWEPWKQPGPGACADCRQDPERQVLAGHDRCLPTIGGRRTADGIPVRVGLRVWDYDLRPGTVVVVDAHFDGTPDGPLGIVAWHDVRADNGSIGMFDGSRMSTRHPVTGFMPPEAPQKET